MGVLFDTLRYSDDEDKAEARLLAPKPVSPSASGDSSILLKALKDPGVGKGSVLLNALKDTSDEGSILLKALKDPGVKQQEKEPEKEEYQPKGLFKVIDLLNRPSYAVGGAVKALAEGKNVLQEAKKGILGQERDTFSDVFTSLGWEPESKKGKVAKFAVSLALDIALDPTTYIGVGSLTKAGKGLIKTGDLASTVTKQVSKGERALLQFAGKEVIRGEAVFGKSGEVLEMLRKTNLGNKVGEALIPNFRPASITPEVWKDLVSIKRAAKNVASYKNSKAMEKAVQVQGLLNKAMKEHGEEAITNTLTAIEKPSRIKALPKDLQEIARVSREYLDEIATTREKIGKSILKDSDLEYLPHIHKNDFLSGVKNIVGKFRSYGGLDPSDKAREIFKFSDEAGNILGLGRPEDFKLVDKGYGLFDKKGNFFTKELPTIEEKIASGMKVEDNLATLLGVAGKRNAHLEKSQIFFEDIKDLALNRGDIGAVLKGEKLAAYKKANDVIEVKAPELKGLLFSRDVAKEIDTTYEKLVNPKEIGSFLKTYDSVHNTWKGLATYVNPAFHSRNAVSNVYQNAIGGVKSPVSYVKAAVLQAGLNGEKANPKLISLVKKTFGDKAAKNVDETVVKMQKKYYEPFLEQGLGGGTYFGSDIQKSVSQELNPTLLGSETLGLVSRGGRGVGSTVEGNARLTHFINKIDKGFTHKAAAKEVRKYLFDYEELTPIEKEVFKRIVPFYTWTRKNIPLQLENVINKPRYALGVGKMATEVEKSTGVPSIKKNVLPEWLQKASPVIIGQDEKGIKVAKLEGYIPITDLDLLEPKETLKQLGSQITPLIKTPFELLANKNIFLDREIEEVEGDKADLLRLHVNPYLNHVLRTIRPINEVDKLIGRTQDHVSKKEKIINLLFGGKIYHIDERKQRSINAHLKRKKEATLKSKLKYRMRLGDKKEAERLKKEIRNLRSS